jgi:hypothetical protein
MWTELALNSPNLNQCDYFLWVFLKEKIFPKKPQTIMELRSLTIQACKKITEDMRRGVINTIVRVEEVARCNSGHIGFTEDKSPYIGLSICMLVSRIVI